MRNHLPLTNRELIRAFCDAKRNQLDHSFIRLLKEELKKRRIQFKLKK